MSFVQLRSKYFKFPHGTPVAGVTTFSATVGAYTWNGKTSGLLVFVNATKGAWTWAGKTSSLSTEIVTHTGTWTWAGTTAKLSTEIVTHTGAWTWAGVPSSLSKLIAARVGAYTWAGTTANLGGVVVINAPPGAWTWLGKTSSLSTLVALISGQYSWAGKHSTVSTGGAGSTVVFFDGLNTSADLHYHKDLNRPHIILTPAGGGTFTVVKDSSLTDMKADSLTKETYLIDGELP